VGEGVSVAGRPLAFDRVSVRLGAVGRPFGTNLFEDEQGRIWSQQHVYDPARDRLDELSEADGRHFGTGWFHSQARLPDGRLVFGGSRGLLVVDPARYAPARTAAPLVLTGLRVNGVARPAPPAGTRLRIEPGERSFGVEFAALDLRDPARVRYGYQLEGFDPDWTVVGADLGVAAYGNLPPGGYRLRVRTLDRGGAWGDAELGLDIEVRPAWWQRPATQGAMALALLAGVAALVQWRTRALRRQRQWLERQVAERTAALEAQSLTDPLTGLHNRRFLLQRLPLDAAASLRRHAEARRQGRPPPADADLLFFVIDLDHFKQVNDLHGHAAGDAVLSQVRERLVEAFRQADHLVRWGGEEFLIAVRDTPRARAAELAERVRRVVERTPFRLPDGRELRRTCSVGFAAFPLVGEQPDALDWAAVIDVADAALLGVKRGGRNGWMGVLSARLPAGDAALETLRAAARGPIDEWIALGGVEVQRSPGGAARSA
jgi:diguanylate cyclase (GGDEF)-like protein